MTASSPTPDRLSALTEAFAQRYLDALRAHLDGGPPTQSWGVAFDAAGRWRPTVLQHLLLGINAHINLDLGIACAEVAPGAAIVDLRTDFEQINDVLAGLVAGVQERINSVSPLYRFVDDISADADRAVVNFSIARARDEAWQVRHRTCPARRGVGTRCDCRSRRRPLRRLGRRVLHPGDGRFDRTARRAPHRTTLGCRCDRPAHQRRRLMWWSDGPHCRVWLTEIRRGPCSTSSCSGDFVRSSTDERSSCPAPAPEWSRSSHWRTLDASNANPSPARCGPRSNHLVRLRTCGRPSGDCRRR